MQRISQNVQIYQRHSEYYLSFVQNRSHEFEALEIEFGQIKRSVTWLTQQQDAKSAQYLLHLIRAISPYLQTRALFSELLSWCHVGIIACERIYLNPGWLLLLKFRAYYALGNWSSAFREIQEAVRTLYQSRLPEYGESLLALGTFLLNRGDYRKALKILSDAENYFISSNDYTHVADVKAEVAAYHLNRGSLQTARQIYHEIDNLRRSINPSNPPNNDQTLLMLGVVYRKLEDYEKSAQYLFQLLNAAKAEYRISGIATATHHLAWLDYYKGDLVSAEIAGEKSRQLYEQIKDLRGLGDADEQLGLIAIKLGKFDSADVYLSNSLNIRRELGNQQGIASTLRRLAVLKRRQRKWLAFLVYGSKSLRLYLRLNMLSLQRLQKMFKEIFSILSIP